MDAATRKPKRSAIPAARRPGQRRIQRVQPHSITRRDRAEVRRLIAAAALVVTAACIGALPPGGARASVAEYRVSFDATWSAATHPGAYPEGAHFSNMVGGTHDGTVSFWSMGGLASDGIEAMAERGLGSTLLAEVDAAIASGGAFSKVDGPSGHPSPGLRQTTFEISSTHSRATVVSMVAPSPDWFVGVDGFDLAPAGTWLDGVSVTLVALDAGTDDGADFVAQNADSDPPQPISTFAGPPFAGTPALGTFTFDLLAVTNACEDGADNDGDGLADGNDPGCTGPSDDDEKEASLPCDDGLDDDGDGAVDLEDPGCTDGLDPSEYGVTECDDGVDNDGDGRTDYPDDADCFDLLDDVEMDIVAPGIHGPAALLLMAGLAGLGFAGLALVRPPVASHRSGSRSR